jgi:hypothetical protein
MDARDAIKLAESGDMTPKERQKMLAIALFHLYTTDKEMQKITPAVMVIRTLWDFSRMINPEIPEYDPEFILLVNEYPKLFVNYR